MMTNGKPALHLITLWQKLRRRATHPKTRIALGIRAIIRRRRIPVARAAEFMGITPEKLDRILAGTVQDLAESELTAAFEKVQTWLDPATFGGTPAALNLAAILSEISDPKLTNYVANYMANQSAAMRVLSKAKPGHGRNMLAALLRQSWSRPYHDIPDSVHTHMQNVLVARWRRLDEKHIAALGLNRDTAPNLGKM